MQKKKNNNNNNRDRESFKHPKLFFTQKMQANTTRTHPTKPIMLRNKNIPSLLCNSSSTTELLWNTSTTTRDSSTSSHKKSHSKPFTRAVSPVFPKSQDLWIDHHNYYMHSLKTNSDLPTTTKKKKKKKKETQH
jgi:hypothetical protein